MSRTALPRDRSDTLWRWLLYAPALAVVLFSTAPLAIMLVYSFLEPAPYGGVEWQISGAAWMGVLLERDIFDDTLSLSEAHLAILVRSALLAGVTTLVTLLIGFPTAYFIAMRPPATRSLWLLLMTIPFWTNLLIRTFAILELIRNEGLINGLLIAAGLIDQPIRMLFTDGAILAGMVYVYLPLMVLPIYATLERLDIALVEAAYDLYATPRRVRWHVIVPVARPGIAAGCILVFIPALGAYVTPALLGGGKNLMLGNLIELQFGQGRNWPLGAALSTALIAVVLLAFVLVSGRRGAGQTHG